MKTLFKIIAGFLALVVVLVIGGTIALKIYLPQEKVKALVLERLSSQLKREVSVESVAVGLFSGLQLRKLKISESPTFDKGTFVSEDLLSIKLALWPLLR